MGNPDLVITIKGWIENMSFLIKGTDYNSLEEAINKAVELAYLRESEYIKLADNPNEIPSLRITDIEIREIDL